MQKGGAIFDDVKLTALNKEYLRELSAEQFLQQATPWLKKEGIDFSDTAYWQRAVALEQERVGTLAEVPHAVDFFKPDWPGDYSAEQLVWRKSDATSTKQYLEQINNHLSEIDNDEFSEQLLEDKIMSWIDGEGLGRGDVLWPMRVALTGRDKSPGQFEIAAILGKEETMARITKAITKL